ncbi:sigma-54-dependent transcriptional regulator [Flagellimonas pacifica]|uniref:Two-component system, NtrC family, response regulator HydG n=1 Tax=Flagellimonas pacifica TaxID=1247520 RepID=A0A285MBW0_9FLAO|nr:sigma-54 dependent transcriptional regulator [Allomuricauda parva]SNY94654.1 two-component system, NtrC family, response regulator HydG [Allomuricauda parva]
MPKILIIEDDTAFCQMLQKFLTRQGYGVSASFNLKEAREKLATDFFDIILCDVRLPEGDGISLLSKIKEKSPKTRVILMTGFAEVKTAVQAMKKGAFDYISKPFTPESILEVIASALNANGSKELKLHETIKLSTISANKSTNKIIGSGEASKKLQQYIELVAPTNMSVLLIGESGTGKEVTARAIHNISKQKDKNFVAVDCGAIPKELATSEFFGHIKGSFTGAIEDKIGHFEAANGGTLFLDEIGNLSYENQVQLLRAIQERKIKRVGSTREVSVDVRIVAATNEDLTEAVAQGNFREDLFHRLNEFSIEIPSLKARKEDLMLFVEFFLKNANAELNKNVNQLSKEVKQIFFSYNWPGNLRELNNVIKRSVLFTDGDIIGLDAVPQTLKTESEEDELGDFSKHKFEKERILKALKQTNFNKSKAAKLLQITRKTLYNKINYYQLEV